MPLWHCLFLGLYCLSLSLCVLGGIELCFIHLLPETCGPLKGTLHRSAWTTEQKYAQDLLAHLYLREFCYGVLATQPRADDFKPASRVDGRITGPLCAPQDQMRGLEVSG